MTTGYLTTHWGAVDRAPDPRAYVDYLDAVSGLETIQRSKQQTFDLLEVREGDRLLDVGCGTGDDVQALARHVGETGRVIGIDGSESMVAEARSRARDANLPSSSVSVMPSGWSSRPARSTVAGPSDCSFT